MTHVFIHGHISCDQRHATADWKCDSVKRTARTVLPNRETHSVIITHLLYNPALEWLEGPSPKAQLEEVLKTRPRFGVARDLKPSGRIVCAEAVRGRNVLLSTRSSC